MAPAAVRVAGSEGAAADLPGPKTVAQHCPLPHPPDQSTLHERHCAGCGRTRLGVPAREPPGAIRHGLAPGDATCYGLAIATALYVAVSGEGMPNRALGR